MSPPSLFLLLFDLSGLLPLLFPKTLLEIRHRFPPHKKQGRKLKPERHSISPPLLFGGLLPRALQGQNARGMAGDASGETSREVKN